MSSMPIWLDFKDIRHGDVIVSVQMQHISSLRSLPLDVNHPSYTQDWPRYTEVTLANGVQYHTLESVDVFKGVKRPDRRMR